MANLYKDFRPTGLDPSGLGLDDRQNWIVCPVSRNRDSGPLAESNFAAALGLLGGESDTVEVHRFRHWGPGWFEIIIVDPARETEVDEIEGALADYPVLDDSDLSEREYAAALESWDSWACRDFVNALHSTFEFSEHTADWLVNLPEHLLWRMYMDHSPDGYGSSDDGAHFDFRYLDRVERGAFAGWLRALRTAARKARDTVNQDSTETVLP